MQIDTPRTVDGSWLLGSASALRRDQLGTYEQAMLTYGDMVTFRVGPPRIGFEFDAVFHPDGAREVLAKRSGDFVKDAPVFNELEQLFGKGLLVSNGDQWRRDRRLVAPLFTPQQVSSYIGPTTDVAVEHVAAWHDDRGEDAAIDLTEASLDYALAVLGRTVFGTDIIEAGPTLRANLPILLEHAKQRGLAPVRAPSSWPTPANRRARRAQCALDELVDTLIERRRATATDRPDLLNLLLEATDPETGAALTDREVREQVLIFLIAGHETTGATLAFTLHLLGRHRDVQDRVRAEITDAIDRRQIQPDDVKQMTYTKQVINESLRMYPPGHTLLRTAATATEVLGHPIPEGRIVAVNIWGIHHHPDVWSDPHTFDPDRFVSTDRHRYSHMPFGGGPRSCIAEDLAIEELVIAVATVLSTYELRSLVDTPTLAVDITVRPGTELRCTLEPIGSG